MTITSVRTMHQCAECATVTDTPANGYGNYYCTIHTKERHNAKATPISPGS